MAISVDERKYSNLCIQSALLSDELNKLRRVVRNHPNNMDKIHTQIHLLKDKIDQIDQLIAFLPNS